MSDLIERLRQGVEHFDSRDDAVMREAADEIDRLRRELASACHQIELIRDLILQHKGEQTADVRQVCSNMDAIIWAWAEDREGDLAPFLTGQQ